MTITRTKRLSDMEKAAASQQILPDQSEITYTFADGWAITRLQVCSDARREGLLMRSCLAKYAGDELDSDKPGVAHKGERADDEALAPITSADFESMDLCGQHVDLMLHSLRDPANLPHLTFWAAEQKHACGVKGFRNSKPKEKYFKRVVEWADHTNCTLDDDSYLQMLDGLYSEEGQEILDRFDAAFAQFGPWDEKGLLSRRRRSEIRDLYHRSWHCPKGAGLTQSFYAIDGNKCLDEIEIHHRVFEAWPDLPESERAKLPGARTSVCLARAQNNAMIEKHIVAAEKDTSDLARTHRLQDWQRYYSKRGIRRRLR